MLARGAKIKKKSSRKANSLSKYHILDANFLPKGRWITITFSLFECIFVAKCCEFPHFYDFFFEEFISFNLLTSNVVVSDTAMHSNETSLMSEIHRSLRSSKRASKRSSNIGSSKLDSASDFSDSDNDTKRRSTVAYLERAFATCKLANMNKMPHVPDHFLDDETDTSKFVPGQGSSLDQPNNNLYFMPVKSDQSYTVTRDNSTTDFLELAQEFGSASVPPTAQATVIHPESIATSSRLGHPGIGQLGSLDNLHATGSPRRSHPGLAFVPSDVADDVIGIQTIGQLRPPTASVPGLSLPLGSVPAMTDSGLTSDQFSNLYDSLGDRNLGDGMSSDGFDDEIDSHLDEFGPYRGLKEYNLENTVAHKQMKLEETLQNLNPVEVEKRRRMEFGDGDFVSGSIDFLDKLPYGVRTPDSIMSTGSRDFVGGALHSGGDGWKLPDKLRIVKPLEGSLTLHNWQQLAMPSLGGIFEERKGIAFRGGLSHVSGQHGMIEMGKPTEDLDEGNSFGNTGKKLRNDEATFTHQTFTDSMVLHPDKVAETTLLTSSYSSQAQMSCGFPKQYDSGASSVCSSKFSSRYASNASLDNWSPPTARPTARISSRRSSVMSDTKRYHGTSPSYSSHIGLARLLDRRDNRGLAGSVTHLDQLTLTSRDRSPFITREMASNVQKLTPSVLSSPKSFSPTGTPLNSPSRSRATSTERPRDEHGLVSNFFSSLKSALYGEQEKEAKTLIKQKSTVKRRGSKKMPKKFGILAKVEEVGVENLLGYGYDSDSTDSVSSSGYYLSGSKTHRDLQKPEQGALRSQLQRVRGHHAGLVDHDVDGSEQFFRQHHWTTHSALLFPFRPPEPKSPGTRVGASGVVGGYAGRCSGRKDAHQRPRTRTRDFRSG